MDAIKEDVVSTPEESTPVPLAPSPLPPSGTRHRRFQTIASASELEFEQLHKLKEVESLHSELEYKSKELETSQEEALLAAKIGQTLLKQNEKMGVELELTSAQLLERAELAEQEVKVLEKKLRTVQTVTRSLELSKARADENMEFVAHELETARARVDMLTSELTKALNDKQNLALEQSKFDEKVARAEGEIAGLQDALLLHKMDSERQGARIYELQKLVTERDQQVAKLETEVETLQCNEQRRDRKDSMLVLEKEELENKVESLQTELDTSQAQVSTLSSTIEAYESENISLKQILQLQQERVEELESTNQQLQESVDAVSLSPNDSLQTKQLYTGSLFFEIARHLQDDGSRRSPDKSVSKVASKRSPAKAPKNTPTDDAQEERGDLLKEVGFDQASSLADFFMLTAAAVKLSGGGMLTDACNIMNEDLYDEAVAQGITFDKFHHWLEWRLGLLSTHITPAFSSTY